MNSFKNLKSISDEIFNFSKIKNISYNLFEKKFLEFNKILDDSRNIIYELKNDYKHKYLIIKKIFEENLLKIKEILNSNNLFKELFNLQKNKISDKDKTITRLTLNLKKNF